MLIQPQCISGLLYLRSDFSLPGRCSLLEPGPVVSSILIQEESGSWTQKHDSSTADQKTTERFQNYRLILGSKTCFRKGFKNVDDVAEIVKNIILSDKPNLRYLTNEKYNVDVSSKGQTF